MKKLFLALMAIAAIALTGCKDKGNEPQPSPEPDPTPETSDTYTVYYMSDCIADIVKYTYTDNNGETKTLTKDNWVAVDPSDIKEKEFLKDIKAMADVVGIKVTDETISHIKKFVVPNNPNSPVMKKVEKVRGAELPIEGSIVISGHSSRYGFDTPARSIQTFEPTPEATEEQKWESVIDYAKGISSTWQY